jgi:uncharacterized protein
MYTLIGQVQFACHYALDGVAKAFGKEPTPPESPDKNKDRSFDDLRSRIKRAVETIEACDAKEGDAFDEKRVVAFELMKPWRFESSASDFLMGWSVPHVYFHFVTAYDILRQKGVPIGKQDYLSELGDAIKKEE